MHPDWRRQGVGARLLLRLVDIALELGAARMTLEVRVSNEAAQELYRRFGFTIAGTQGALLHRRRRGRLRDDHARAVRIRPCRRIIGLERERLEGRVG